MNPFVMVLLLVGSGCLIFSVLDVIMGGDMVELAVFGIFLIFIAFVADAIGRGLHG